MNQNQSIYTVGGTVQAGGGIYIKRKADDELIELCRKGEFAFILSSRQVGKSSLMVNTAEELAKENVRSVIIDLSAIGVNLSADEWYLGILNEIATELKLESDIFGWWNAHSQLGQTQRLVNFFRDVMLKEVDQRVVLFFDEIDSTLSIKFSDDFFAALRAIYNARSTTPDFSRLSFVLIGVATPSDLISDSKRTPFNIGRRVELTDFSLEEAAPLKDGFGEQGDEVLQEVFAWTSGHPYLTQRLCLFLASEYNTTQIFSDDTVSSAVTTLFIGEKGRNDTNLQFVRDMLLERASDPLQVLKIYNKVLHEDAVKDDGQSKNKSHLKLSGVVRKKLSSFFRVSNRIYSQVFSLEWVEENISLFELKESLLLRAFEWRKDKDKSWLLKGQELKEAREKIKKNDLLDLETRPAVEEFIAESQKENGRKSNRFLRGVLLVLVSILLACLVSVGSVVYSFRRIAQLEATSTVIAATATASASYECVSFYDSFEYPLSDLLAEFSWNYYAVVGYQYLMFDFEDCDVSANMVCINPYPVDPVSGPIPQGWLVIPDQTETSCGRSDAQGFWVQVQYSE